MGFRLDGAPTTVAITEGPYAGVELQLRRDIGMAAYFATQRFFARFNESPDNRTVETMQEFADLFATEALVSWNLEDRDGAALPATAEGVLLLPAQLLADILPLWLQTIGVTPPLASAPPRPARRRSTSPKPAPTRS